MLRGKLFLICSLVCFAGFAHAITDSTAVLRSTDNVTTGYNLINVFHLLSNMAPNYSPSCPTGTAFSGGQYIPQTSSYGYYTYNCTYLNVPANSELAAQIAAMASGFTACPEDVSNPNLRCTTKFNTFPITVLKTHSCVGVYCETSVMFGDNNEGYAFAFTPVGNSPTITIISSNGTRGGGWDYRNPCQDKACDGYNYLTITAYVFPNTTYQVFIKTYREGGWRTSCPVYLTDPAGSPDKGDYNGTTITFTEEDIGKTCMFDCAGTVGGSDPDFYQDRITKTCY